MQWFVGWLHGANISYYLWLHGSGFSLKWPGKAPQVMRCHESLCIFSKYIMYMYSQKWHEFKRIELITYFCLGRTDLFFVLLLLFNSVGRTQRELESVAQVKLYWTNTLSNTTLLLILFPQVVTIVYLEVYSVCAFLPCHRAAAESWWAAASAGCSKPLCGSLRSDWWSSPELHYTPWERWHNTDAHTRLWQTQSCRYQRCYTKLIINLHHLYHRSSDIMMINVSHVCSWCNTWVIAYSDKHDEVICARL